MAALSLTHSLSLSLPLSHTHCHTRTQIPAVSGLLASQHSRCISTETTLQCSVPGAMVHPAVLLNTYTRVVFTRHQTENGLQQGGANLHLSNKKHLFSLKNIFHCKMFCYGVHWWALGSRRLQWLTEYWYLPDRAPCSHKTLNESPCFPQVQTMKNDCTVTVPTKFISIDLLWKIYGVSFTHESLREADANNKDCDHFH